MSKDMSNTTNTNNLKKPKSYTLDTPFNDLQIRGWYLWIYVLFACSPMGKQLVNFITCGCESSAPFLQLVISLYELLGNPTT
jgi:hypothetical protein